MKGVGISANIESLIILMIAKIINRPRKEYHIKQFLLFKMENYIHKTALKIHSLFTGLAKLCSCSSELEFCCCHLNVTLL